MLHQFLVRPGIDLAAALEVDMRAQDAAKAVRLGHIVLGGQAGAVCIHEELFELRAERADGRRVGAAGQGGGAPTRLSIRLEERGERRPLDDHGRVEPLHQTLELVQCKKEPGRAQHAPLNFTERGLPVEVANDVIKTVKWDQNWLRQHPSQILEHHKALTLMLDSPRHDRPKLGSFERRHASDPGPRSTPRTYLDAHPNRTQADTLMLTESQKPSSHATRPLRQDGDQRKRPHRRGDFHDRLGSHHRYLSSSEYLTYEPGMPLFHLMD